MNSLTWHVGKVKIAQVTEIEAGDVIQAIIPSATKENISKIAWLKPHFADGENNLKALVQAFVVETADFRAIIDPCVGNSKSRIDIPQWNNLQTNFLSRLEKLGYTRDAIDMVVCTHLHFDHVGWNTTLVDGAWVPTFPRARYIFAEPEFNYWKNLPGKEIRDDRAGISDSVVPVWNAGLVDLVRQDYPISNEISLLKTPGHTPGHVSILIHSSGKQAVITGDTIHHPCQIAYPDWDTIVETDSKQARLSRRALLDRFANTETRIIGTHFAAPTAGYLRRENDRFVLIGL